MTAVVGSAKCFLGWCDVLWFFYSSSRGCSWFCAFTNWPILVCGGLVIFCTGGQGDGFQGWS